MFRLNVEMEPSRSDLVLEQPRFFNQFIFEKVYCMYGSEVRKYQFALKIWSQMVKYCFDFHDMLHVATKPLVMLLTVLSW